MKKPQPLTERIWNNIKSPLFEVMEEIKGERLQRERQAILTRRQKIVADLLMAYRLTRPITDIIPGPADMYEMHEFKTIIEDTPFDEEVTERTFEQLMTKLPSFIDKWRDEKDAELLHIMDASYTLENDRSKLDLATAVFKCYFCPPFISYPRILFHFCLFNHADLNRSRRKGLGRKLKDCVWNCSKGVSIVEDRTRFTRIVECYGLDPDLTTAAQLDQLDARLECIDQRTTSKHLMMDWRSAVSPCRCAVVSRSLTGFCTRPTTNHPSALHPGNSSMIQLQRWSSERKVLQHRWDISRSRFPSFIRIVSIATTVMSGCKVPKWLDTCNKSGRTFIPFASVLAHSQIIRHDVENMTADDYYIPQDRPQGSPLTELSDAEIAEASTEAQS